MKIACLEIQVNPKLAVARRVCELVIMLQQFFMRSHIPKKEFSLLLALFVPFYRVR